MIPRAYIAEWYSHAPWPLNEQVEQDLVISRALVEIFSNDYLKDHLAFRGGTALNKLYLTPPARYSEDIDLVQVKPGPIGKVIDSIREALGPWLGEAKWKQNQGRVTLVYSFESEIPPTRTMKLKIEINSREHFSVFGFREHTLKVQSSYFSGESTIATYTLEELLGTKLRALYQRKKGRDLFDIAITLNRFPELKMQDMVHCFHAYLEAEGTRISKTELEENLGKKLQDKMFRNDLGPLLARGEKDIMPIEEQHKLVQKLLTYFK